MEIAAKRQVVVIHGGDPKTTDAEFIADLAKSKPDADDFKIGHGYDTTCSIPACRAKSPHATRSGRSGSRR